MTYDHAVVRRQLFWSVPLFASLAGASAWMLAADALPLVSLGASWLQNDQLPKMGYHTCDKLLD